MGFYNYFSVFITLSLLCAVVHFEAEKDDSFAFFSLLSVAAVALRATVNAWPAAMCYYFSSGPSDHTVIR